MDDLQALVISAEYKQFMKRQKAKEVKQIVLDEKFWNNYLLIVRVMTTLIRLLRLCDTDEKPSLGYIYEGIFRARMGIMNIFKNKKKLYKPYIDIIDNRWDCMLRQDLHAAVYYLNPAFQYDKSTFCTESEIICVVLNVMDKVEGDDGIAVLEELRIFRDHEKSFARAKTLTCSKITRPCKY